MRSLLISLAVTFFIFGCDPQDITDSPPIGEGGAPSDAGLDAAMAPFDASMDAPPAELFCQRYDSLCGYIDKNNAFADAASCLAAYESFTADQVVCVESELGEFESDGAKLHCQRATGSGPCK